MFIKYGEEQHLVSLMENGAMFFNPCRYFRDLEAVQKQKGIGDGNDGGVVSKCVNLRMVAPDGKEYVAHDSSVSFIVEPALKTPVFCLRKTNTEYISANYREKLRSQFPKHTHALIIRDESEFKENVRYGLLNKAFAHTVFYEKQFTIGFYDFLKNGSSDIRFIDPENTGAMPYLEMHYKRIGDDRVERLIIDGSNYYKTMFRKDIFFSDQCEYRFVLPYEQISEGKSFSISPFHAKLCAIDDLVRM